MKKTIALLSVAIICLTVLAGCGTKENNKTAEGSFADLSMMSGVQLGVEEYGIAFRSGSDMVGKVDAITAGLFADGTIATIAEKYELKDNLVPTFAASADSNASGDSDYEYIKSKGVLVVGITDFDPMNYKDKDGKWIGFDTEYAEAVADKLGIKAEFKEIVWDNKELELSSKSIDCIWNGMTITDAIVNAADVTGAYIKNYQVVVVKDADTYTELKSLKGKKVVAESGSAGETAAKGDENLSSGFKAVESQADALLQVKSGQAAACVIDYVMAKSMLSK